MIARRLQCEIERPSPVRLQSSSCAQHVAPADRFAREILAILERDPTRVRRLSLAVRQRLSVGRRPNLFMLVAHVA
jgi:hypothetical protein